MMALNLLHEITGDRWYVDHLRYLTQPLISGAGNLNDNWLAGEFTTQISTRVEGLVASLVVELRLNEQTRVRPLVKTIIAGLRNCYDRQIGSSAIPSWSYDPRALGGFVRTPTQLSVRIDYVQHALCASFGLMELVNRAAEFI
jgi:hypothetical protein